MADDPTPTPVTADPETTPAEPVAGEWRGSIAENLREHEQLQKFDTVNALAQGYITSEAMIGADKVAIPGREATDEVRREFFTRIGCPQSAAGYEMPTDLPDDFTPDTDQVSAFNTVAHEIGLTDTQAKRLIRYDIERQQGAIEAISTATDATKATAEATLRKEWGEAYEQNMEQALLAVESLGGEELKVALNETGFGNDARIVMAFSKAGRYMKEDEIIGKGQARSFTMTPEEARQRQTALLQDTEHQKALHEADHPAHAAAMAEETKLSKLIHPETVDPEGALAPPINIAGPVPVPVPVGPSDLGLVSRP